MDLELIWCGFRWQSDQLYMGVLRSSISWVFFKIFYNLFFSVTNMGFSGFINAFILILLVSSFPETSMADPRTTIAALACNSTVAYSGKLLAANFVPAMYNLSNLINQNGFGTTKVGQDPNALYGLAQCYKDLSSIDCRLCFSEIRSMLPTCHPRTGGRIFLDGCFGRFENFPFFNQGLDSVVVRNCSSSKNTSQPDKFEEVLKKVTANVIVKALKNNGSAVGSDSVSNFSVYALAQCWDSLDQRTCNSCLQASASSIISCSPAVEGRLLNAGCYMRYSGEIFWNLYQSTGNSSGKNKSLWKILGAVLCGCLILTGIGLWKVNAYLSSSLGQSMKGSYGVHLPASISHSNLHISYQELKRATNNFDSSNKLGQGSYGTVYKGILPDGREVAVKRLFLNTRQWVDQFVNEVNLVNQVRHKNIARLLACSVDGPESLLVYECYFNKSLDNFIFDKSWAKVLDWQKRFDVIQGVADGLSYLHEESDIRIIHRDIKASNILLDAKFKAKITDFGLARSFAEDQSHLSTGIAGTLGYMAPEYVVHGHLTEKADVYSFGVLILEIVTGLRCNNGIGAKAGQHFLAKIWSHYKTKTIEKIIDKSFYEEAVQDEILHVVHIGLLCIQATPCYRPTMAKVAELLRSNGDHGDVILTDPPFLDILATDITEEDEGSDLLSLASGPSFQS